MKMHVIEGNKMLKMITENFDFQQLHHLDILQQIVSEHHERIDGSGYLKGLKDDEISIVGRITAVADVFDAMSSRRVYSEPIDIDEVFKYMRSIRSTLLDKDCVDSLIKQKVKVLEIFNKFQDKDI